IMHRDEVLIGLQVTAGIAKGASAVADIIATIALCYQLSTSRTGIKQYVVFVA
ncbi:hypothetical protein H0H87_003656, partial [Tephrocybe sp. NHM501043]